MANKKKLDHKDLTHKQLVDYRLKEAAEHAKETLRLTENLERDSGKKMLSDAQREIFQKIANVELLTDEEQQILDNEAIYFARKIIKQAWGDDRRTTKEFGKAYEPEFSFQNKAKGLDSD